VAPFSGNERSGHRAVPHLIPFCDIVVVTPSSNRRGRERILRLVSGAGVIPEFGQCLAQGILDGLSEFRERDPAIVAIHTEIPVLVIIGAVNARPRAHHVSQSLRSLDDLAEHSTRSVYVVVAVESPHPGVVRAHGEHVDNSFLNPQCVSSGRVAEVAHPADAHGVG
jgi:hypothetical protein